MSRLRISRVVPLAVLALATGMLTATAVPAAVNDNGQIVADVYGTATNQTHVMQLSSS